MLVIFLIGLFVVGYLAALVGVCLLIVELARCGGWGTALAAGGLALLILAVIPMAFIFR